MIFSNIKLSFKLSMVLNYKTKKIFLKFSKVSMFQICDVFLKNKIKGRTIQTVNK